MSKLLSKESHFCTCLKKAAVPASYIHEQNTIYRGVSVYTVIEAVRRDSYLHAQNPMYVEAHLTFRASYRHAQSKIYIDTSLYRFMTAVLQASFTAQITVYIDATLYLII